MSHSRRSGKSPVQKASRAKACEELPLIPIESAVLFPNNVLPLTGLEGSKLLKGRLFKQARGGKLRVAVVTSGAQKGEDPLSALAPVGTEAVITGVMRLPNGQIGAVVTGTRRFRIRSIRDAAEGAVAEVEFFGDRPYRNTPKFLARSRALINSIAKLRHANDAISEDTAKLLETTQDPTMLCDLIAPHLSISLAQRVALLRNDNLPQRVQRVLAAATHELEYLKMAARIREQVQGDIQENHRRAYLQEQIRALRQELNEIDGPESTSENETEVERLRDELMALDLPESVLVAVERELDRMEMMSPGSPEYMVSSTYVNWIKDLPWHDESELALPSLAKAQRQLERDHHGLRKVKDRILEYLAVMRQRRVHGTDRGEILLLVGPPGVGKTSLARSIATALERPFVRISLGGVRDEAEIRGHRRTYIGSLPGKLIQAMKQAQSRAPVILLDEIDKVGLDHGRSDLSHALLEVLDYEQNHNFVDHYLALPYDLSQVIFIATANTLSTIAPPLRDRMEIVELPSYTELEKLAIAKQYLLPEIRKDLGLRANQLQLSDKLIKDMIYGYTREAGVRQLKRELLTIARKLVKSIAARKSSPKVTGELIERWLGPAKFVAEPKDASLPPGVAIGLAYTSVGGEILYIESNCTKVSGASGRGQLSLTGSLGKVMRESAQAAVSYLAALGQRQQRELGLLNIDSEALLASHIHLHLPDGGTPKDGPSAGVAIMCAIASLFSGRSIPADIAMTGEITLRGQVLPVGGIREKVLAAHRYGKRVVLLPAGNVPDLRELPPEVRRSLRFVPLTTMAEALRAVGLTDAVKSPSQKAKPSRGAENRSRRGNRRRNESKEAVAP